MGLPLRKAEKHYTYRDYKTWPEDERWELIDGVAYLMSVPSTSHQSVLREIFGPLYQVLKGKPCKLYGAPVDVFFPRLREQHEDDVDTVVQPDLVVVCDKDKIRQNGIWTAPDFAVEILSPSTSRKDQREKYDLYERSGVKEYWIVDPVGQWMHQYVLGSDGKYEVERIYLKTGRVESNALEGFVLDLAGLWAA